MNQFQKIGLTIWLLWVVGLFFVIHGHDVPAWYQAIPIALLIIPVPALWLIARILRAFGK